MTTTLTRPNAYPAKCIRCGARIAAREGLLARTDTGEWAADHVGDCPEKKPATIAIPVRRVESDGIYRTPDGVIYKVLEARQGSGRLYAKRLILTTCEDGPACPHPTVTDEHGVHRHGHFTYQAGAVHTLTADMRLPRDEAVAFGKLYGVCVRCGADLTDEKSIRRGLGPWCAGQEF